jgi:3-hydroxybutyryl-CoA dehydratase
MDQTVESVTIPDHFMSSSDTPQIFDALPQQARDMCLDDTHVGAAVTVLWRAEDASIDQFTAVSGDLNPLHMDADYARENGFDGRVVHGFLLGARISGLIGMVLPGRRCLLLEQKLSFPHPVYVGDDVEFRAVVEDVHPDLSVMTLAVSAHKSDQKVMRGRVTCKLLS